MPELEPTLPGLDPASGPRPPLVESVRATYRALEAAGLLEARHAATMELALFLADALASSYRGRGASTAMLARELRETLALLPEPPTQDPDADAWTDFESAFRAAASRDTA